MIAKSAKTSPKPFSLNLIMHPKFVISLQSGVKVNKGPLLDGVGNQTKAIVQVSKAPDADVAKVLKASGAEVMVNLLPSRRHKSHTVVC